ncbi:AAA family ATPase [Nocardia sp. NPDC004415]
MQIPAVGRQTEIARLRAAVLATAAGASRVVLLRGPAGIGKTWLTERAAELAAAAGLRIARGAALDDTGACPLRVWTCAAGAVPGLSAALRTVGEPGNTVPVRRFRMYSAVAAALCASAEDSGLALILEDLHWADPSSLELLTHLVTTESRARLLILATIREPAGNALLAELPDWLCHAHVECYTVPALSEPEIGAWIEQRGGAADLAPSVRDLTGGNPLLIHLASASGFDITAGERCPGSLVSWAGVPGQTIRELGSASSVGGIASDADCAPVSDTELLDVRGVVLGRHQRLSPGDSALLSVASVLGERIDTEVLAHLTGAPAAQAAQEVRQMIAAATEAGLVRDFGDAAPVFVHAVVRDVLYTELPCAHRAELHRSVAEALADRADTAIAGLIATHWRASGATTSAALRWFRRAAHAARLAAAYPLAIRFGEWAIEAARTADDATRAELLLDLARDEFDAGWIATSLDHSIAAASLADEIDRPDLIAEAALVVHDVSTPTVLAELNLLCSRALRRLDPRRHPDLIARLMAQHALFAADRGAGREAAMLSEQALYAADRCTDPEVVFDTVRARYTARSDLRFLDERTELAARSLAIDHPPAQLCGHLWTADTCLQRGDLTAADTAIDHLAVLADSQPLARWHLLRLRADRALLVGDLAGAREFDTTAADFAGLLGDPELAARHEMFRVVDAVLTGHMDKDELRTATKPFAPPPKTPFARLRIPILHALSGDLATAATLFAPLRDLPDTLEPGPHRLAALYGTGVLAELLADTDTADRVYRALSGHEDHYAADGTPFPYLGSLARIRADNARVAGHLDAAVDLYHHALTQDAAIQAHPYLALTHLALARTHLARADLPTAHAAATTAAATFRHLGLTHHLHTAETLLRRNWNRLPSDCPPVR